MYNIIINGAFVSKDATFLVFRRRALLLLRFGAGVNGLVKDADDTSQFEGAAL